jgi:hypothetical protein
MSKKKSKKELAGHGGKRPRSGHPKTGITKTKKCVSVNKTVWQSALNIWRREMSPLVETLLSDYVENAGSQQKAEAI